MNRRWLSLTGLFLSSSVLCWFFPLFHIRPLGSDSAETSANEAKREPSNGKPVVSRKLDAYLSGVSITDFWDAYEADSSNAQKQYGQQSGLGGAWYFRLQGEGIVQAAKKNQVVLTVGGTVRTGTVDTADGSGSRLGPLSRPSLTPSKIHQLGTMVPSYDRAMTFVGFVKVRHVRLELGAIVDSTVREAVGVKASQFANSQEFNEFSAELNRQVEQDVIAPNRGLLQPGSLVKFIGCGKVASKSDLDPLTLVPIQLTVRGVPPEASDNKPVGKGVSNR